MSSKLNKKTESESDISSESDSEQSEKEYEGVMPFTKLIDVKKYIKSDIFTDDDKLHDRIDELNLSDIRKSIKHIFTYIDDRIVYHGVSCTFNLVKLYKYKDSKTKKDYYLILNFDLEGDEDDFFANIEYILDMYDNVEDMLNSNIIVMNKEDFKPEEFLDRYHIGELRFIIQFFNSFYSTSKAAAEYFKYITSMFEKFKKE